MRQMVKSEDPLPLTGLLVPCPVFLAAFPLRPFSQNVGLVAMTHVVNRKAIASGALIMILAGLFPAFGVILASLPDTVLGGCTLMMFGSIVSAAFGCLPAVVLLSAI